MISPSKDTEAGYSACLPEFLDAFDRDLARWRPILVERYGDDSADLVSHESREEFMRLVPLIPYIGGQDDWLDALMESVRCLALYHAMKHHGKTAEETGRVVYEAVLARADEPRPAIPPGQQLAPTQLMARRRERAERTQERRYGQGYVCEFVPGDGQNFDYGYNFTECAAQKFYQAQGAAEFLPSFCALDFAYSQVFGLGLTRTMTLSAGQPVCNHRFKSG